MQIKKSFFYSIILTGFLVFAVWPLIALDCREPLDISVEARIAYYHPSSSKVRRIYGDGWADYQVEIYKQFFCDWRICAGASGFSRKGESIGFHDHTRLQLIPVSLGVKYFFPFCNNFDLFVGGAACYSFLRIKDDSDFVRRHAHKNGWGGLVQSGVTYYFRGCAYVSAFADYYFQEFHFNNSHHDVDYDSIVADGKGYIERTKLDMSGYKVGVGFGFTF